MEKYIYYSGQRDWGTDDYDYLNSFLNRIFLYRDSEINKYRISTMNIYAMEDTTKAMIKAILMQQNILDEIISQYPNLAGIKEVKPLEKPLFLQAEPTHLFPKYEEMNIIL